MARGLIAFLRARWHNIRYGFLFVPGLIVGGMIGLAFVTTRLDHRFGGNHGVGGFTVDASTSRTILQTIGTALITVAGLTFSLTVLSLQLVSQQFSPRALRTFLGDRPTQIVAGAFVGIFAYCLLALRSIRGGDSSTTFVPSLSITLAVALGIVTLGLLLYFIHHMSNAIQLSTIAAGIARATLSAVDRLGADEGEASDEGAAAAEVERWQEDGPGRAVRAKRPGFVQTVALDELPRFREEGRLRVHVLVAPGDFVTPETELARFWSENDATAAMHAVIAVENERDVGHDPGYGLRQLADIAIKALSPGVNDPTTAATCVSYMQAILERLVRAPRPAEVVTLVQGRMVAVVRRPRLAEYLEPLAEVARHARDDERVSALVDAAARRVAELAPDEERRRAVAAVDGRRVTAAAARS